MSHILDTTKQGYVVMRAIREAGKDGLNFNELLDRAGALSQKFFGVADYVFLPSPLIPILKEARVAGALDNQDRLVLSPSGLDNLAFLEQRFIKPAYAHIVPA